MSMITITPKELPEFDVVVASPPTFEVVVTPPPFVGVIVVGLPGPPGPAGTTIHVGPTPPLNPLVNDLWVDTT